MAARRRDFASIPLKRHETPLAAPEVEWALIFVVSGLTSGGVQALGNTMYKFTCVLLASTAFCATALAQNDQAENDPIRLDPVDVVGLRPLGIDDVTSSVTVMTAEDLAVRRSPYVADQLRGVPGLGVSRSGSSGGLTQIRVRGAEANHTLVLLDGIEISDPVTGETDFGLLQGLPLDRVEVARGEHSSLYGSDAIGGVVALSTQSEPTTSARAELGTQETYRADGSVGGKLGSTQWIGAASAFSTAGIDTSGRDDEKDGSDSYSVLGTARHDLETLGTLSGLATYRRSTSQTDPDLDFDGLLDNADRETVSDQWILGTGWAVSGFGVDHQLNASFSSVERENRADGQETDTTTGERAKFSYSPAITHELENGSLDLAGLIDWESEDYKRRGTASSFGDPNQTQTFETLGVASEVRLNLNALDLSASIRHDNNDGRFDDATTWRIGGAYSFTPAVRLRASAGEGVKNPTFTELFGFYPGSFIGNPDLLPESSTSWEIGLDSQFGPVQTSLTYFQADLENEIYTAYTSTFASTPMNRTGDSERSGVEFAANWMVDEAVSVSASLSNISSENETGVEEIRVPEWTGSIAINWQSQVTDGFRAGLALDYVGEQLDTDFGTYQTVTLDSYILVSGTAEYPISDSLSLTLRGENLLDEEVTDVFGYHAPGAAAFIGLKLRS